MWKIHHFYLHTRRLGSGMHNSSFTPRHWLECFRNAYRPSESRKKHQGNQWPDVQWSSVWAQEYTPLFRGCLAVFPQPWLLQLLERTPMLGLAAWRLQLQFLLGCDDRLLYVLPSPQYPFHSFMLPLYKQLCSTFSVPSNALKTGDTAVNKTSCFVSISVLWSLILLAQVKKSPRILLWNQTPFQFHTWLWASD